MTREPDFAKEARERIKRLEERRPMRRVASLKLGELVGVARECHGWSLRELEQKSGVSNALISQIETGKIKDPGFSTVVRLIDALGISLERAANCARPSLSMLRARQP